MLALQSPKKSRDLLTNPPSQFAILPDMIDNNGINVCNKSQNYCHYKISRSWFI